MITREFKGILVVLGVTPLLVTASGCQFPVDREAKKAFWSNLGETSITVFPAFVRRGRSGSYDRAAAARIGALFADRNLAQVSLSDAQVPITGTWHRSQPTMLKESAEAFAAFIKRHRIATEFALLPEYLMRRSRVAGIHCYVVDADGRLAYVVLQNSHWPIFADVNPKSVDEGTEVLIRVLEADLGSAEKDK